MKKIILGLPVILCWAALSAQDTAVINEAKATGLRADSKIYVVIVVLLAILAGLFLFLARLDKKISRLEKKTS